MPKRTPNSQSRIGLDSSGLGLGVPWAGSSFRSATTTGDKYADDFLNRLGSRGFVHPLHGRLRRGIRAKDSQMSLACYTRRCSSGPT